MEFSLDIKIPSGNVSSEMSAPMKFSIFYEVIPLNDVHLYCHTFIVFCPIAESSSKPSNWRVHTTNYMVVEFQGYNKRESRMK